MTGLLVQLLDQWVAHRRRAWRPAAAGGAAGLTALLAAAWLLLPRPAPEVALPHRAVSAGEAVAERAAPAAVRAFLAFAADSLAPAEANASHDYATHGLALLADALAAYAAVGGGNADTAALARVGTLRRRLAALRQDGVPRRRWSEHTRWAREACFAAGDALDALAGRGAPSAERDVAAVWDAAGLLETERGLIEQADRVQRFFDAAATALRHRAAAGG